MSGMELVKQARHIAWNKGYVFLYLGQFTKANGNQYYWCQVRNEETQEVFSGTPTEVIEWLRD